MRVTAAKREAARRILRGRDPLPGDVPAFGRAWGMTAAQSQRLVDRERQDRDNRLN